MKIEDNEPDVPSLDFLAFNGRFLYLFYHMKDEEEDCKNVDI
jgi:hypothetical protein